MQLEDLEWDRSLHRCRQAQIPGTRFMIYQLFDNHSSAFYAKRNQYCIVDPNGGEHFSFLEALQAQCLVIELMKGNQ